MEGGWIEWHGGKCPVKAGIINVRYRDGWEQNLMVSGTNEEWLHMPSDPDGDIVAYRIINIKE